MGFGDWLKKRKFHLRDFLEPVLALPFGYLLLRYLSYGFDTRFILLGAGLLFVYLPLIIIIVDWKNRK